MDERWRSTKTNPPEYGEGILLRRLTAEVEIGYRERTDSQGDHYCLKSVRSSFDRGEYKNVLGGEVPYWMPLPE
jgi:hypothetical protein